MSKLNSAVKPPPPSVAETYDTLSADHLEWVAAWGNAAGGLAYVYRPSTVEGVQAVLRLARDTGRSIGLRGAGNSYGDAAINSENIVLDLRRMSRVLDWQPDTGRIQVEPGVTLAELWLYVLEDGWWPPVATGTSKTTMGGCVAMNVHGKNAWQLGPIGEHVLSFDLVLSSGEIITCTRDENSDVFHAAIGGFGMLGVLISITIQMKRVYSGLLDVRTESRGNLVEMFSYFDENLSDSDYIVGWVDAMSSGSALGRGDVHRANYLLPGADPNPVQTLRPEYQRPGDTMFGVVPRSMTWMPLWPLMRDAGMKFVNFGKYTAGHLSGSKRYLQPHVQFHFLLDYGPDFRKAYEPGRTIQYQPFIPKETAMDAFAELLALGRRRGLPNYLTVLKRHRPDDFLMSYAVDGYSLAMDFRVTDDNRNRIVWLTKEMDQIVLEAGGRFYFAKDITVRPEVADAFLGDDRISRFKALKERCDPDDVFETDLWRRVFA